MPATLGRRILCHGHHFLHLYFMFDTVIWSVVRFFVKGEEIHFAFVDFSHKHHRYFLHIANYLRSLIHSVYQLVDQSVRIWPSCLDVVIPTVYHLLHKSQTAIEGSMGDDWWQIAWIKTVNDILSEIDLFEFLMGLLSKHLSQKGRLRSNRLHDKFDLGMVFGEEVANLFPLINLNRLLLKFTVNF